MRFTQVWTLLLFLAACSKPSLPPLPEVSTGAFLPSIRQEIERELSAVRAAPEDAERNGRLGMLLHAHDRMEAALACYERARMLKPEDYRWPYLSGVAHASLSRNREAAELFRTALRLKPQDIAAQLRLAEAFLGAGDQAQSRASYEKVMQQRPGDAIAYYGAGRTYASEGNLGRAAELYQQACERYPSYGAAHYALGLAYRQLGRAEDARAHLAAYEQYKTAVPPREDPLMAAVQSLSGGILPLLAKAKAAAAAGRLQEAVDLHLEAIELDPQQEQTHINLISLYGQLKQFAKAEEHYRSAVARNPNREEAHYNYAVLLSAQGRFAEAVAAYRKTLVLNPSHAEAHNNLGYLLARQRKFDEALEHSTKALESKPGYPQAHFNAGMILMQRGQTKQAIQHLKAAVRPNDPNAPQYLQWLAKAYARDGNPEQAREYEQKARDAARAAK
jgi:tetratricopeptide (TPR) repeat protein